MGVLTGGQRPYMGQSANDGFLGEVVAGVWWEMTTICLGSIRNIRKKEYVKKIDNVCGDVWCKRSHVLPILWS
jgi:hypothetical protein